MKKIIVMVLSFSAFLVSCSSPYYPEYVPVVSLGASTSALVVENDENTCTLNVISNMEYTASIISGSEWLSFTDTDSTVRKGNGNTVIEFKHLANNHDKRVAYMVLAAETRRDTVRIKQKGNFEDFLEMHPDDKEQYLTMESGTRLLVPEAGREYEMRLKTSCQDHEIQCWTDAPSSIVDFKVENKTLSFRVKQNVSGQPLIMHVRLSYVDGWDDTHSYEFSIKQEFDPLN